jgi:hypothetical protein
MGREMQNNKMSKVVKFLIFIAISATLLANVVFIIWAAQGKLWIIVPNVLSAIHLVFLAAFRTILK